MQKVVIAIPNLDKVREFADLLADVKFKMIAQTELGIDPAEETGLLSIADDSSQTVDASSGALGIYSERYAWGDAFERQNLKKLIGALKDVQKSSHRAKFNCVLVYMRHAQDPTLLVCHGSWAGKISIGTLGKDRFGYDLVLYLPELGRTTTELSRKERAVLSYRGKALKLILATMRNA